MHGYSIARCARVIWRAPCLPEDYSKTWFKVHDDQTNIYSILHISYMQCIDDHRCTLYISLHCHICGGVWTLRGLLVYTLQRVNGGPPSNDAWLQRTGRPRRRPMVRMQIPKVSHKQLQLHPIWFGVVGTITTLLEKPHCEARDYIIFI